MLISDVVARASIPATTLRYYEDLGLITARRSPNGYRTYDESVLDRLAMIEAAKQLNLSLPETAELLLVVDSDSCTQVHEVMHPTLQQRLRDVDERLASLQRLRDRLAAATRRVAACPDSGDSCRSECALLTDQRLNCTTTSPAHEGTRTR
ncbi:Cu(I)-responsive transcriptional regulator [Paractinoplanes ferrugineus]|uniref:Cu(I)-responsive transcriptional regulator n=1 Tax=Paractinoplanes ferrugineus TaxID=113564 RepID=A0A919MHC4_9ACTN|nr:MerR family transcriptional regulator [Actinoplanes ferrugineus]GIE15678.1 Cu(I)-responsive transcriptional regulator [Actinoplanes ferrugineus]